MARDLGISTVLRSLSRIPASTADWLEIQVKRSNDTRKSDAVEAYNECFNNVKATMPDNTTDDQVKTRIKDLCEAFSYKD